MTPVRRTDDGRPLIRVLLADDEPLIRVGVRTVLESAADITVVAEAGDGRAALEAASAYRVDVAVLDISMPRLDGLAAAESLLARRPAPAVVVLTAFGLEENVLRAVRGGAVGFVLKNCAPEELIGAVRAAHAGQAYLSPAVTRLVLDQVRPPAPPRRADAVHRLATLTARETAVLRLVAEGMSNAEIGRTLRATETTVKTYVSRILAKLACTNRVQAALLARDALHD
ncbi:DNA-binding response regulator [Longispora fulva]|uniref:DNA-binding NarL/FixJ family response regulator n=1 Tax=Longispora fulva TaxID=619741 RepID=A0A8J7KIE5_9ACTN|nr:response regulator transcription factor [Longispora fulva]MBG6136084.1 DNA-binding NarL/FixJ family response regulator [Longispora fulva]GIG55671.1 DNA-binding response regulator [Longispora fulva]